VGSLPGANPFEIAHHESEQKFLHKKHALEEQCGGSRISKVNPDESAEFARLKAELELSGRRVETHAIDPETLNQQLIGPTERDARAAAFISQVYGGIKMEDRRSRRPVRKSADDKSIRRLARLRAVGIDRDADNGCNETQKDDSMADRELHCHNLHLDALLGNIVRCFGIRWPGIPSRTYL
jgi:hypothetical protein